MRKLIALFMLSVFVIAGCTVVVKPPTDSQSIQRSKEAHKELDDATK